ncbi:MAG: J domain-containing protein [Desulfobacteraceae bacterium]|nr:J domain-containing protein [Desulfobacteraceae bacterium]
MDLGADPALHISYMGGHGFCFSPAIGEKLEAMGICFKTEDLERVFKPYLRPDIQTIIERYRHTRVKRSKAEPPPPGRGGVHIFDARRLYFLRFARIDTGELGTRHWKFLNVLLSKSRDEIETLLEAMEQSLPPREFAAYVYASLGIAPNFPGHVREHPVAIDRELLDRHVIDALCALDRDSEFFAGVDSSGGNGLHPYLRKYAWLYFDSGFHEEDGWPQWFRSQQRFERRPAPSPDISMEAALAVFGIGADGFREMTRKELLRLYRRKAKKKHPDKGGEHNEFVRLSEAYARLIVEK